MEWYTAQKSTELYSRPLYPMGVMFTISENVFLLEGPSTQNQLFLATLYSWEYTCDN